MTWWSDEIRSPHDVLAGVKMLAREVDKVRADLGRIPVASDANDELLDEVFFSTLGTSKEELTDVVRTAWVECQARNVPALFDLRESLQNEPEISDAEFMVRAQASDVDAAAVRWLFDTLGVTGETIEAVNAEVERLLSVP